MEDTIAAIATGTGEAAIGLVRLSGPHSRIIAERVFRQGQSFHPAVLETHRVYYGTIVDPLSGVVLDEVLLTFMEGPRSYTREDVIEVGCHGGTLPLRRVLGAMLKAGARLAEPGEFTRRAFQNGRIDLAQAEAVSDMIRARSNEAAALALHQLQGSISREITRLRTQLLGMLAAIEASIDFPEDDLEVIARSPLQADLVAVGSELEQLLASANEGRVIREGIRTTIVGKPNVGKSSLLNALLGHERAIVTPIAGTTRDLIEETVVVGGITLVLTDTAGIHMTDDVVESEGVQRAQQAMECAQLLLVMLDDSQPADEQDEALLDLSSQRSAIILLNKIDLDRQAVDRNWLGAKAGERPVVEISARLGQGLERLYDTIRQLYSHQSYESSSRPLVASLRHINCLQRANQSLQSAVAALERLEALDIVSIDLREAIHALGEITGDSLEADIIDRIFQDFCLGK